MAEISSLIPKKTLGGGTSFNYSVGVGVFFRVAFILFLAAAFLTGGLYLFRNYISTNLEQQRALFKKLELEFEPSLIAELERVSNSIKAAKDILSHHARPSLVFNLLETHTLNSVSFSGFTYDRAKNSVVLTGEAPSYTAISAQTAIFNALDEIDGVIFTGPSLQETGTVTFSLTLNFK